MKKPYTLKGLSELKKKITKEIGDFSVFNTKMYRVKEVEIEKERRFEEIEKLFKEYEEYKNALDFLKSIGYVRK